MSTTWHSSLTGSAPRMTSNTSPAPYVASASAELTDQMAWRAFSGDPNYEWMTPEGSGPPWWIQFDWGAGAQKILERYTVGCRAFFGVFFYQRCPYAWELQGSNDGLIWDTLDTVTGQTAWPANQVRTFTCDVAVDPYRYFRMYITMNNGAPWPTIVVVGSLDLGGQGNKFY